MPSEVLASLNQISQIGLEVTPGTPVPATRRLQSIGIEINPSREIQEFKPRGFKFSTAHAETRKWSEGSISDGSGLAYNEAQFVLASVFSKATPVEIGSVAWEATTDYRRGDFIAPTTANGHVYMARNAGESGGTEPAFPTSAGDTVVDGSVTWVEAGSDAGGAYMWRFDISTYEKDDVQTYTVETGDRNSSRSYRAANAFFTSFTLESARSGEVSIGGDLMASSYEPFAFTSSGINEELLIPATPPHLDVYMDDDPLACGTTFLDGNFSMSAELSDRANQYWWHGRRYAGPAGRVETEPSSAIELVQADGEEVDDLLLGLENGMRKYLSFDFMGPAIAGAGVRNRFIWDVAAQIGDSESYDDEDGVYAATVPLVAEHDGTWGRSQQIILINGVSSLS